MYYYLLEVCGMKKYYGKCCFLEHYPRYFMLAIFYYSFFIFFSPRYTWSVILDFQSPSITTVWVKQIFMVLCLFLCILTRHPSISGAFALSNAWPGGAVGLQSHHTRDCVGGCYSIRSTCETTQQSTCDSTFITYIKLSSYLHDVIKYRGSTDMEERKSVLWWGVLPSWAALAMSTILVTFGVSLAKNGMEMASRTQRQMLRTNTGS